MTSPAAPIITTAVLGNQSMSVYFTQGDLGGGNVVKYMYSLNGSEYVDAVETTSPISIGMLTNGTVYSVSLIVVTDAETANFSSASDPLTGLVPYTAPDSPTISAIGLGNEYMSISIADGASNGGYDLSGYQYSIDGGVTYTEVAIVASNPIVLTGLTNGTVYTVSVKSVSLAPDNNVSAASIALTAIPYTEPDAPTISAIDASNACLVVYITNGASSGGYDLSGYKYSTDGGVTYLDAAQTESPVIITGLTNSVLYSVSVKSVSAAPTNNLSMESNIVNAVPYTNPEPPTVSEIVAGNGTLTVSFTDGALTGGYDISGYLYSINGGATFVESAQHVSPIVIEGLTNGVQYSVSLKSVSTAPDNNISPASAVKTGIPCTEPQAPVITAVDGSNTTLTIHYTDGETGGYRIKKRQYTIDNGATYVDCPRNIPENIKADALDELTLKIGNASLNSAAKSDVDFFPTNATIAADGTFTIAGQAENIKNGTYKVTASSYYGTYKPGNLLDSNTNTIWSADWSTPDHRYLGNETGTYTGTVTTDVVGAGSVAGEWFQLQFPNPIAVSTYGLEPYPNFFERFPNEFYVVGSNDGTTWEVVDHKTGQTITNYNLVTYTLSTTVKYSYIRVILVSMTNSSHSEDLNISSFRISAKNTAEYVVLPEFTTTAGAISVSAWIKTASLSSVIMDLANGANADNIKLMTDANGHLLLYVKNGEESNVVELSAASVATNEWKHVLVNIVNTEVDGAIYTAFIDGVQSAVATQKIYPSSVLRTSNYLFKSNNGDLAIEGNMDDLRIYGRELSVDEVKSLVEYKNQSIFSLNVDAALLVYELLDYADKMPFAIEGLTNGVVYPVNMREITYAPTNEISAMSADSSGIPYTAPSAPTITQVDISNASLIVYFNNGLSNGGYPISKYLYSVDGVLFNEAIEMASPIIIRGLTNGQSYGVWLKTVSSAPENNVSLAFTNEVIYVPYTKPNPPILSIDSSNQALILHYADGGNGGFPVSKFQYLISEFLIDESLTNAVDLFPVNNPSSQFTVVDNVNPLRNGTYKVSASSYYVNNPVYNLFDGNENTAWEEDWSTSQHLYSGDGNGTYTGIVSTTVENVGIVSGEWFQIEFPTAIIINKYSIGTYSNFTQRYPKEFYILGSTTGQNWYVVDHRTNQSVSNFNLVEYNSPNKTIKINFMRFIFVSMTNNYYASNGFNLSTFRINAIYPLVFTDLSASSSSVILSGLVNGKNYNVSVKEITTAPTDNISNTATIIGMPTGSPNPPTFYIDGSNQKMIVHYTEPAITGGYPIIKYLYNIDGGQWFEMPDTTGYYEIVTTDGITPLENGTMYEVKMKSVSAHILPEMATSIETSSVFNIPYTVPTPPTILNITPADRQLVIKYQPSTYNGGYPISKYEYSLDNITFNAINQPYKSDYVWFNITGSWITGGIQPGVAIFLINGMKVYACTDGGIVKMSTVSGIQKYYAGTPADFSEANWNSYTQVNTPGAYVVSFTYPLTLMNSPILDINNKKIGDSSLLLNSANGQYATLSNFAIKSSGFSMAFWICPNIANLTQKVFLLETTGNYTNTNAFSLYLDIDGSLKMTTNPTGTLNTYTLYSSNLNTLTWTHVAITINKYKRVKTYINCELVSTNVCSLTLGTFLHSNIYIGKTGSSSSLYNGNIDDYRIYNGKVLSINEIGLLYNYNDSPNFALNTDSSIIVYSSFNTNLNTFSIDGLTNGFFTNVYLRAKTSAPRYNYSTNATETSTPFGAPSVPELTLYSGENYIDVSYSAPTTNGSGYNILKYQYSIDDGALTDIGLTDLMPRINNLVLGEKYDVFLHTVSDAPLNAISTSNYKNIGTHIQPLPPTITSIDASNTCLIVHYAESTNLGGYDLSGYQYSMNSGATWNYVSLNEFTITGLTNGTLYTFIMRTVTLAPDNNNSLASTESSSIPYTSPSAANIYNIDSNGSALDVYYGISNNGGYSISHYELSVDNGAYVNIGTQMPYPVDATGFAAGTSHLIKIIAYSTAPLNNTSIITSKQAYYVGTNAIPAPFITGSDISANAMNIYYTQTPYEVPMQKYICTEDETTYSEITEIINSGKIIPSLINIDPSLCIYYNFSTDSIYENFIGNVNSSVNEVTYTYDASMSTSGLISKTNKITDTGSLELSSPLKWVTLPSLNLGREGFTIAFWFRHQISPTYARIFDFDHFSMPIYGNSFYVATSAWQYNSTVVINDGVWRHFALTLSSSGYFIIYINKAIVYQSQRSYPTTTIFNKNYLGKSNVLNDNYPITGNIDDFRIYKKVLNATDVSNLYGYVGDVDTRKTTMQYDLTSPLTIGDLLNGRAYAFKLKSVLDTSNSVVVANPSFSSGTSSWTMDGSFANISSSTLSQIRQNNGVDALNALYVGQSSQGSTILYQPVNVYGSGKYILKVTAAAGSTYDASQTLQIGVDGNYSTSFKMVDKWKNYIHIVDIPESISTKNLQLKINVSNTLKTNNEYDLYNMYLENEPFTGNSVSSIGMAINADETRVVQTTFNGSIQFASKNVNGTWNSFQRILDYSNRKCHGICMTEDGNRIVLSANTSDLDYCYFSTWNGTNYNGLIQTLDNTPRNYLGCAMSKDGSRFIVSEYSGYIYFATWNGTNYTQFTKTLDLTSRLYVGIGTTNNANRIVYATGGTNTTYYADWNGTNYGNGIKTEDTSSLGTRCLAISNDMKYIYHTSNGSTNTLRWAKWNGTNYSAYIGSSVLPAYLDGWGLAINKENNALYLAPYGTNANYKIKIPSLVGINQSYSIGNLAALKSPWGIYSAEDYNPATGLIPELRGYNLPAVVSGTGAVYSTQGGNGISVSIPQITGTTSTKITFPTGSIPSTFTICGITRLAGSSRNRVLQSTTGNWFLGHRGGVKACANFEGWKTANGSPTNVENWQVICGKNTGSTPNNILADGVPVGVYTGGVGGYTLCINNGNVGEFSDFGFSHVFIWNQALTDTEMQTVSQSLMDYLQTGNSYKTVFSQGSTVGITNVSLSKAFISPISNATDSIIPYSAPLPPTINTIDASNAALTVSYADSTDNGGYSITKYQYSVNGGTFVDVAVGTNTFDITGLTNGTSYTVVMRSVSAAPSNNYSGNSLSKSGIPYTQASPLTITTIDASNTILYVNFSTSSTGGYSLVKYEYSLNGGAYVASAQLVSPLTLTGLTNGTTYAVKIRQVTGAPANSNSPDSNTISSIPFKQPLPPTITSLDPSNQRLVLNYTNTTNNGGYSIDKYQYKINDGAYIDVAVGTTQVYLDELTNGTSYTVAMRSVSTAPFSNLSVDSLSLSTIPYTRPSAPTITSIDASNTALTVNFTEAYNGGYSFVRYEYSLNNGTYVSAAETASPIKITGLTNATVYLVKIRQVTSAPTINLSPDSNAITETPYTIPSAPVITTLVPGNRQITVNYTAPASNGRPITSYKYSLNGGAITDISSTQPLILTGLINSYSYDVAIYAVNLAGTSLVSNTKTATPFSVPTAPAITQTVPGDRTVTFTFTPPDDVGGYPILGYKYSFGIGAFTAYTDAMTGYSMTFNNLVNGNAYVFRIKAFNSKGDSPASNAVAFTPNANPATPTITGIVPTMDGAILKYADGVGSALISGYKYSVNGNSFLDASRNVTGAIVKKLAPGIAYRIKMRAFNPLFDSSDSNAVMIYPGAPDVPTITNITVSGTTASIYFTQPVTDCPAPTVYQILNDGEGILTVSQTSSPIVLSNLKYGTSYNIKLRAMNQYNMSYASNGINASVGGAVPDKIKIVLVDLVQSYAVVRIPFIYNNTSSITTIKYSLNEGQYVDLNGNRPIFKIPNIAANTQYSLTVVATNTYGDSIPSNPVSFINRYTSIPDQPRISNMEIDVSGTLKIFLDSPISSIIPVDYYKYKLVRNYVEDAAWTFMPTANRILTIDASVNVLYTARIVAVNGIGSSTDSPYWLSPVKYTLGIPSTPNIDGIYNTYDGNLSLFFTIQNTNGAKISDILYSIDNGATYQSSGRTEQPIIVSGLPNNTQLTFRIKAVNAAGTTAPSKAFTFIKYYKAPNNPYITRLSTSGAATTIRILAQDNGGSPITGFKYSMDGGALVAVSLNASKEFTIMNIASGVHTIKVYATNEVGDSAPFIKKFTI